MCNCNLKLPKITSTESNSILANFVQMLHKAFFINSMILKDLNLSLNFAQILLNFYDNFASNPN